MKVALLVIFLLSGCASKRPDCLTLTPAQLGAAMQKAWQNGYVRGHEHGEDVADKKGLKPL